MRTKIYAILIAFSLLLVGCSRKGQEMTLSEADIATLSTSEETPLELTEKEPEVIYVYVCGAVNKPGVYRIEAGKRVVDAVEAAGGFADEADNCYINLAANLEDGVKLRIPTIEETSSKGNSVNDVSEASADTISFDSSEKEGLVNLNTATAEQLKTLPGIGDGIADRIVKYRTENGGFSKIEDIMKISGIKDKLFQKIKDKITV